jgi:2-polyprenyl-3-methyl-5-hydroxy-6-metoxy-1,4-benzoquinol methylase
MTSTDEPDIDAHWGAEAVDPRGKNLPALKARFLLDHLPNEGRVLEVGSGDGKLLRTLHAQKPALELHGCDVRDPGTPPDVYEFRRLGDTIPMADNSLDVVFMFDVLEHVPSPEIMLAEAARVCRPNGKFLAFVPIEGEKFSFYELYRLALGRDTYRLTKEHVQAYTHGSLRALLEQQFELTDVKYVYHLMGQFMDATFFAAARARTLRAFWWNDNVYYNADQRDVGVGSYALNKLLELGNGIAWAESTLLARTRFGSAGIMLEGRPRK